jgi:hypothetical protein
MIDETSIEKFNRLGNSIIYVALLNDEEKLAFYEQVIRKQPVFAYEIILLNHLKVSYEKIEYVIDFLLILYDFFTDRGSIELPTITSETVKAIKSNLIAFAGLLEKEDPQESQYLFEKSFFAYPQAEAMRFYIGFFKSNGLIGGNSIDDDYCLTCAIIILDCFMRTIKKMEEMEKSET